ncbi:hypothetical protein FBU30_009167 [Linnemannia zychae]|nr:hypothetical protein FBU30_009167 [Linnemannia zychae]
MEEMKKSTIGKAFSRTFGRKSAPNASKASTTTTASPPSSPPSSPPVYPQSTAAAEPPQRHVTIDTHPATLNAAVHHNGLPNDNSQDGQNFLLSPDSISSPSLQPNPLEPAVPLNSEKTNAPPVHFAIGPHDKAEVGDGTLASLQTSNGAHTRQSTMMSTNSTTSREDGDVLSPVDGGTGLNPTDILLNRLMSYRAIVKNLQQYFTEIAMVEQGTSKAMQRASTLIYVPFRDGHQFVGQGGLQDVCIGVRDSARTRSDQHAAAARFIDETIVKNLRRLKQDIKARVKALKSDNSLYSMKVFKEREATQERIGQLARAIGLFEKVGYQAANMEKIQSDPYLIHLATLQFSFTALKRQLAKQVHEENVFSRAFKQTQEQIRNFEAHIIKEIKQILAAFAHHQIGHDSAGFSQSWAQTEVALQVLQEDTEWTHFVERYAAQLFPSELVDSNPEELDYPCKESPYIVPVKTAHLTRKSSVLKNWKDGFFVLTLAGWLHVFSSSKDLSTDTVPERSIYLPTAVLGPHSDPTQKQHVFSLDGKGMGGLLHRDAQTFTVRAHSREEMLEWWEEIAKRTQSALVTQQVSRANTIDRGTNSPELKSATIVHDPNVAVHQGPTPPYDLPNEKTEIPNTTAATHPAAPVPAGGAVATTAAAAPVVAPTTATTTVDNMDANAAAASGQPVLLTESVPARQQTPPLPSLSIHEVA